MEREKQAKEGAEAGSAVHKATDAISDEKRAPERSVCDGESSRKESVKHRDPPTPSVTKTASGIKDDETVHKESGAKKKRFPFSFRKSKPVSSPSTKRKQVPVNTKTVDVQESVM